MMDKPLSVWKIILLIAVFTVVLSVFRAGWISYHQIPEHPEAEQGLINLSDWDFSNDKAITLDGEWEFYPDTFLAPGKADSDQTDMTLIDVPGNFNSVISQSETAYGYGTYKLKIYLPDNLHGLYGIRLDKVQTSATVYINKQEVLTHGVVGSDWSTSKGRRGPVAGYFQPDGGNAELLIHIANYGHPLEGGLLDSVRIGNETAISKADHSSRTLQLVVAMILLLHCLYAFVLYFIGRDARQKELLYFGLLLALISLTNLVDDDIVLQLPISYEAFGKLTLLLFISTLMTLFLFIKSFFNRSSRIDKFLFIYYLILVLLTFVVPLTSFSIIEFGYSIFYAWTVPLAFFMIISELRKGSSEAIYMMLFLIAYTSNILWGFMIQYSIVQFPYYPFDFLFTVIVIAFILLHRQIKLFNENKHYTRKLEEADKQKDEFLANTSHELRNPLHSIISIAYSDLEDKGNLTERQQENLQLIISVGEQMRFTLNDLLDGSKLQDKTIHLQQRATSLNAVLSAVVEMLKFSPKGKNIIFRTHINEDFPLLHADKNRLIQILFNLLHNAVKFTNEGSITISAKERDNMAYVTVSDTGIGINKKDLEYLFRPYEQFHDHVSAYEGGTGLGLSICKQLVELHGGTIDVQSEINEGTTFTFTIPLADKSEAKIAQEDPVHLPAFTDVLHQQPINDNGEEEKPAVLLVDDDPINLRVLSSLLENTYSLGVAQNGKEALEILNKRKWDLVVADVMMPNMTGYALTEFIRQQYSIAELPILLLTARAQKEDIYTGFVSGANDYLVKPVSSLELKARVRTLTALRKSIDESLKYEAAWLQAQIQPHFLFNTLNTIASIGVIDNDRMITLLHEFGNYLEKSFASYNVESVIPLDKELDLLHSYLYIEKTRFGDKLEVKWELDKKLDFNIPPLSIQPIIENAIRHGILKRIEGGTIRIKTSDEGPHYQIAIIDDGVGMDQSTIQQILDKENGTQDGVGVSNINQRLLKLYNQGLIIESIVGEGTTVSIQIPKQAEAQY